MRGMDSQKMVWLGVFVGSALGGFIPSLWGADMFSLSSFVGSTLGAFAGIYLGFKLSQY
jgi:uncharacterized membrane protein YeaQ/YmgE (transglycosylase-associated protein family)